LQFGCWDNDCGVRDPAKAIVIFGIGIRQIEQETTTIAALAIAV
jgi:hypothetical protein